MSYRGQAFWDATLTLSSAAQKLHNTSSITSPYEGNPLDLTIFVSLYNEEPFIENTLNTIAEALSELSLKYEIIVIDDGSKDQSREIVRRYIESHPDQNIMLRANAKNKGLAQNYFDAAFIGKGKYYRLICGDNSEPVETMIDVFKSIGEADMIVPYYVSAEGKSQSRQLISRTYTRIINLLTGNKINYYNGLHVHLRYNIMRWHPNTRGFGFQADILCQLIDLGFTYKQVPVRTIEQRGGRGNAITGKNLLSVSHTILDILLRRLAKFVYKAK